MILRTPPSSNTGNIPNGVLDMALREFTDLVKMELDDVLQVLPEHYDRLAAAKLMLRARQEVLRQIMSDKGSYVDNKK